MIKSQHFIKNIYQFSTQQFKNSLAKTFFKRDLPKDLVQFSSEKGKLIFKEALLEGNLESYFPLSEQFQTQQGPPTCGATTLAMVFNSLGLDPQKRWKGIWRWWSEDTIEGITQDVLDKGMDLEFFTHITKHNQASIQTFYYQNSDDKMLNYLKISDKTQFKLNENKNKYNCELNCHKEIHKTASIHTFKAFIIASSRRTGMYLVLNNSRKFLNQTGDGHFMPIGGFNINRDLVLCFDVARFKYPPYWVPLEKLYKSLQPQDQSTQKSRGFALISKCYDKFSQLCRISPDFTSIQNTSQQLVDILQQRNFKFHIKVESNKDLYILNIMESLPYDFGVLIVYFLFETLNFQEIQSGQNDDKYKLCITHIELLPLYQKLSNMSEKLQNNQLLHLLQDTVEQHSIHILTVILYALPKQLISFPEDQEFQYLFSEESYKQCECVLKQVDFLRKQVGLQDIEDQISAVLLKSQKQQQYIEIQDQLN